MPRQRFSHEIVRSTAQVPPPAWESMVVTGKARSAIRRATRAAVRRQYAGLGRQIMERAFARAKRPFSDETVKAALPRLAQTNIEDMFAAVGRGEIPSANVVRAVYPDHKEDRAPRGRSVSGPAATPSAGAFAMETMQALVKKEAGPGLWLDTVPVPRIGINDVLIRVLRTGICGTDVHIYKWDDWAKKTIPVPMVVGHEFVGEIVEVGSNVVDFHVGEIVSGEGHVVCGRCRNCLAGRRHLCKDTKGVGVNRPGAFAEYLALPMTNVWHQAKDIDLDVASIFDPFGNATHTALSFNLVGEDVLITGAGPIGIMAVAIARHVGARNVVITDVNEYRLGLAAKMGATRTVNIAKESLTDVMSELHMTEGFDVGLEMSGVPSAFTGMLEAMNHGGKIALLGIPPAQTAIDWNQVIFKGLEIKGIYGREMFETWYKMVAMLQSGLDLSPILTHRFAVDDYEQAFATMLSGESGKVILDWAA